MHSESSHARIFFSILFQIFFNEPLAFTASHAVQGAGFPAPAFAYRPSGLPFFQAALPGIRIDYADWRGQLSKRVIEPHTLVFFNNSWYSKAFCYEKKQPRTFSLRRIKNAELLDETFEPDKKIIASVNPDDFLGFEKIGNVKLRADKYALDRLKASPLHSGQVIHDDGTVEIPAIAKEVLFPFLLAQEGNVKLLEPISLKKEFRAKLRKILADY